MYETNNTGVVVFEQPEHIILIIKCSKMALKEEDKDLNYWKENAKDAYMITPICVLRYITELEKAVKNNSVLPHVRGSVPPTLHIWNRAHTCTEKEFNKWVETWRHDR